MMDVVRFRCICPVLCRLWLQQGPDVRPGSCEVSHGRSLPPSDFFSHSMHSARRDLPFHFSG